MGERNEEYKAGRDLHNITLLDIHHAIMGQGEKAFGEQPECATGIDRKNRHFSIYLKELKNTNIYDILNPKT